jgi:AraC-like DNA-binding protein
LEDGFVPNSIQLSGFDGLSAPPLRALKNYFVYLPKQPARSIWGCVATATGFTNIPPHQTYPPRQHPLDHYFNWNDGRVLQSFQIILISAGSGIFECAAQSGPQRVEPGTILVLFPGVWHRYRPDPDTGWVEHWIECHGPVFNEAAGHGLVKPTHSLLRAGVVRDVGDCFERCHGLARVDAMANQDLLSTLGLQLLALLGHLRFGERGFNKAIDDVVQRAHTLIALRCQEPLNLPALAAELGVGYSNLRHNFMARVGISLGQHYQNTRIQKAQELLVNTPKSVKEVAEILGFESASHLSKQFKQRIGVSPNDWRMKFSGKRQKAAADGGRQSEI